MMVLLCTEKLLCSLLYSSISFPLIFYNSDSAVLILTRLYCQSESQEKTESGSTEKEQNRDESKIFTHSSHFFQGFISIMCAINDTF
jgi:hypothetical protein